MRRRLHSAGRACFAWVWLVVLLATPAWAIFPAGLRAAPDSADPSVRVVVAVLPFTVNSERPLGYLEDSLADLLAARLEASGVVDVVEAVTVRESLVAFAGERTEDAVRRLASRLGADYVVIGSLTELAGRYSLDVRVTPVDSLVATSTMVFTAQGDDELLDRVNELATRILEIVGSPSPQARVADVRVEGAPELTTLALRQLLVESGAVYSSGEVREDLERLRAVPEIASATAEIERTPLGVKVTYRLVSTERILPTPETITEAEKVADVQVRGNRRIEANAIRARVSTQPGDVYNSRRVAADIREVYALGFFRNVRVLSEDSIDGRVLIFEVEENPVIRQVSLTGNDSIDAEKIRDNLTLTTGSTLDYPLLFENRERVEALYRAEGYYLARVRYEIEDLPNDAVAINFDVVEGDKLRLQVIEFRGNEEFDDEQLTKGLKTKTWHWYSYVTRFLDRSGTYSEPVFLQDLQAVSNKYLDAGYIQVDVSEPDVVPTEEGLLVRVDVNEGKQYRVGQLDVAGDETVDVDKLRETLDLQEGDVFNRSFLNQDLEQLESYYTDRGFFLAEIAPLTAVDEDQLVVDVNFRVEKGPLYFLREIDISGNTTTVDSVVRREVRVVEGQLYSARALSLSRSRIRSLGFFEEVNFEPLQTDYPDQLDLDVKVVEKPTGSLSFGAGFSSQDGLVITGAVAQTNLFGRGYGGSLSADVGGDTTRFFLTFSDPYFLGSTFGFSAQLFSTEIQFESFDQSQTGIDLVLSHSLDETGQSRGFLRYSYSSREITDDSRVNAASLIFRELLQGEESTSLFGLSWREDSRNDRVAPTAGRVVGASFDVAGFGGFSNFTRLEGRAISFYETPDWFPGWFPFKEKSTWVLGLRAGYTWPFNEISDFDIAGFGGTTDPLSEVQPLDNIDADLVLPLTERYFLGGIGAYQLRGFKARSVGPRRAILKRTGFVGTGVLFTPVGREVGTAVTPGGALTLDSFCNDEPDALFNNQGNGNGKCNSLRDSSIDDFDDLEETDVIGGSKFFSVSTEYRFPISESLGLIGILFFDFGNAFDESQSIFDATEWRFGTGFGGLWFSPFGPLQAFVGFPLDKLEDVEESPVFEFSVGGATF